MTGFDPQRLCEWTGGQWLNGTPRVLEGFSIDTRTIQNGDLFVALKTERRDGHDFLQTAKEKGAGGAVVSSLRSTVALPQLCVEDPQKALQTAAAFHRRQFTRPVIGLTGSCGKTSTKELLALLLEEQPNRVLRTQGNLNNHLGVPLTLLRLDPQGHDFAVVEAGISGKGEMKLLADLIAPSASIVTTIAEAHLDGLGSLDGVAAEKAVLPQSVGADGVVVIPSSCLKFSAFRSLKAQTLVVGGEHEWVELPADNYFYISQQTELNERSGGCRIHLRQPLFGNQSFDLPRLSPGMVNNAALAITLALQLGVAPDKIQTRLEDWSAPAFRGQIVDTDRVSYYVDCYNANPASMRDAVTAFKSFFPGRSRHYVLGCMNELGAQAENIHFEVGRMLGIGPGELVCILGREAEAFRSGIVAGGADAADIQVVDTLDEARDWVQRAELAGGAVLLKGSRSYKLELLLPEAVASRGEGAH